ncbi:MAG: hypothetical protein V7L31_20390 [Nostoc sp.]|uniref:hypothetical protein n=1 Tax=Nostoc sp. TaxID=1180 RepID=UPI002FF1446E
MRVRFKAGKVEDLSKYSKYVYLLSSDRNYLPIQLMIATHPWVKTRFIASLQRKQLGVVQVVYSALIFT